MEPVKENKVRQRVKSLVNQTDIDSFVKTIKEVNINVIKYYAVFIDPSARSQIINRNLNLKKPGQPGGRYVEGWSTKSVSQQTAIITAWREEFRQESRIPGTDGGTTIANANTEVDNTQSTNKPAWKGGKPARRRRAEKRAEGQLPGNPNSWANQVTVSEFKPTQARVALKSSRRAYTEQQRQLVRDNIPKEPVLKLPSKCPECGCRSVAIAERSIHCYRCSTTSEFAEGTEGSREVISYYSPS